MKTKFSLIVFSLGALIVSGCGADRKLDRAMSLEKEGKVYKAWEKYQEFAAKNPQHARAPEAVFRAGWVAQRHFGDCFMAQTFYDEVLTRYPDASPWGEAALLQKNSCPDYFPLVAGSRWVEGDSDTKGKNARIEITCEAVVGEPKTLPSQAGVLMRQFYAGDKKSLVTKATYRKDQLELREYRSENAPPLVLLKWPVEVGTKWSTQADGRLVRYEIASLSAQVSVVAGDYDDCLHVRSSYPGDSTIRNEFYAPGIGRILTSMTTSKGEKRITELLEASLVEAPDFLSGSEK